MHGDLPVLLHRTIFALGDGMLLIAGELFRLGMALATVEYLLFHSANALKFDYHGYGAAGD